MSTKQKAPSGQPWKIDELGIITWAKGTDPIEEAKVALDIMPGIPENLPLALNQTHLLMALARTIALSLFGNEWDAHVIDVYDRLKDMKDDFDHANDPIEPVAQAEQRPDMNGGG